MGSRNNGDASLAAASLGGDIDAMRDENIKHIALASEVQALESRRENNILAVMMRVNTATRKYP